MRLRLALIALALGGACGPQAPEGMVIIPGGEVWSGSTHAGPNPPPEGGPQVRDRRKVRVASFAIDRTEVTRAAYARFLLATGYRVPSVGETWADGAWSWAAPEEGLTRDPEHPVVLVSWYDAREFCAWRGARLPTDVEWELAALGPDGRAFPWGESWDPSRLNHGQGAEPFFDATDGWEKTSPVGAYPAGASPYGLLDSFGGAWEWTADAWGHGWADAEATGPTLYRGARGGSYYFDFLVNPEGERNGFLAELRRKTSGLRCAVGLAARAPEVRTRSR